MINDSPGLPGIVIIARHSGRDQSVYERYVTSPDGVKWIVGRRWLFGRPRYRGFKFGRGRERYFEPARASTGHRQSGSSEGTPPVHKVQRSRPMADPGSRQDRRAVYRDLDDPPWTFASGHRRHRSRAASSASRGNWGGVISSGVRTASAVGSSRPARGSSSGRPRGTSGGRSRGASSSSSRDSGSGSRSRGGAAAAGGGVAAIGPMLLTALKWVLIIAVIALITAFTIFVALPFLLFLLQLALVGLVILWREVTGRPYIVEAREARAAPRVQVWKVVGLKQSRRTIDEVAEAIRAGVDPQPAGAEPVTLADS